MRLKEIKRKVCWSPQLIANENMTFSNKSISDYPHLSLSPSLSLQESDHLLGGLSSGRQVGRNRHTVPFHQAVTVNGADTGDMLIHLASNSAKRLVHSTGSAHNEQNTHQNTHTSNADTLSHVTLNFPEYVYEIRSDEV